MSYIVIGGTRHVMGNKLEYFNNRIQKWRDVNPDRAKSILGGATGSLDFINGLTKTSEMSGNIPEALRLAHEELCRLYITHISAAVCPERLLTVDRDIKHQSGSYSGMANQIHFHIVDLERIGGNYTDNMYLLKNMRFANWDSDNPDFLGFCRYEPVKRFHQLLKFPIEQFGHLDLPRIEWPAAPQIANRQIAADSFDALDDVQPELAEVERYYKSLAEQLGGLITELTKLIDNYPTR